MTDTTHDTTWDQVVFEADIRRLAEVKAKIKELETQETFLAERVMAGIFQTELVDTYKLAGVGTVKVETKDTTSVSREILIAQGVPLEKIEAATKVTTSKAYIKIYPPRAPKEPVE